VRASCVELTGLFGLGDPRHLQPLRTDEGPVLWPVDRSVVALVWGERGYPGRPGYRAHERVTAHQHRVWSTDGTPYDEDHAAALVASHAREFVAAVRGRIAHGGLCVCAFDTELLGHWWHEGVGWLEAVIGEALAQRLALAVLDEETLVRHPPAPAPAPAELGVTSWGAGGDLRTWSGPAVADLAWLARSAELRTLGGPQRVADGPDGSPASGERALRELLALQSSDWAFLADRGWAGDYPRRRAAGHAGLLERALASDAELEPALRNLAPLLAV
jgi:1,4-alpha-glucan branching enzyme